MGSNCFPFRADSFSESRPNNLNIVASPESVYSHNRNTVFFMTTLYFSSLLVIFGVFNHFAIQVLKVFNYLCRDSCSSHVHDNCNMSW